MVPHSAGAITASRETSLPALLGRMEERTSLAQLLGQAGDGHGGAVVLLGEAGIGKSALLDNLADQAHDFCICRAAGVESEMELAYAGLQQLCRPVIDRLADLPALHRNALEKVFGLGTGPPPDRFLVGIALLDLVSTVTREQPLLWLIDDAQWLDGSTIQTLGFAGRRLLAERLLMVIAARDTSENAYLAGLPQIRLAGLDAEDAGRLLDSVVTGPTDPPVRERIIAETRGNPLALLELRERGLRPKSWRAA